MSVSGLRSTLPPLSAEEQRHSRALAAHTRAELLSAGGWLSFERVVWLERLPETPLEGVIIANEVADALPCRRFRWQEGKLRELGVALAEQGAAGEEAIAFREQPAAPDAALARECERLLAPLGET